MITLLCHNGSSNDNDNDDNYNNNTTTTVVVTAIANATPIITASVPPSPQLLNPATTLLPL
jgi:hypothetical protein